MSVDISRRSVFRLGAAAGLGLALAPGLALARAPMLGTQAPYFYRFKLGQAEATVVSDGTLPLGEPSGAFLGAGKPELAKMLSDNFLPPENVVLEQNVLVVNTGDKLVVFDTGMGISSLFGASTGRLASNLKTAGFDPATVDAIVLSHAHIDHLGGIMSSATASNFPNAQIYIAQADFDFWTDEAKLAGPAKVFIEHARFNLMPNRERIVFFKDGEEFLPGIQAMAAPGHTVGHTIFFITSGKEVLAYIADLAHHAVLLIERPRIEFAYDTDPKQSAETRVRILDLLTGDRTRILAYHFPWPGIGHFVRQGDGYRYLPAPMAMIL
ncbi:MAG: MBL fold metallo-hydrolase [Azospirillum sp.]|nr:MBL fold metallo-hydrolase [Azospirillum sp.]